MGNLDCFVGGSRLFSRVFFYCFNGGSGVRSWSFMMALVEVLSSCGGGSTLFWLF